MEFVKSAEMHTYCFRRRKFETIGVSPVQQFVQALLNMPFDDVGVFRAITDQEEHLTLGLMALMTELIFKPNRVTERILPCGTPISRS